MVSIRQTRETVLRDLRQARAKIISSRDSLEVIANEGLVIDPETRSLVDEVRDELQKLTAACDGLARSQALSA